MSNFPETGFVREKQIIGKVDPENPNQSIPPYIPVSRSQLWRWVKDGVAPRPKKLGSRVTVWDASEVRKFAETLISQES